MVKSNSTTVPVIKEEEKENLPAKIDLESLAGVGFENTTVKDIAIPFLLLLQALSPQLQKNKGEYIVNAEAGDIFNSVTSKCYSEGINVIPCFYNTSIVEWKPKRGGFVGQHTENSPIVLGAKRNNKGELETSEGNILVDTAYCYVLIEEEGLSPQWGIIAFSSTQLKKMRKWMSNMMAQVLPSGRPYPMFAFRYHLSTVPESNDQGNWYGWKIEKLENPVYENEQLLKLAMEYTDQIKKGLVKVIPVAENSEEENKTY